MFPANCGLNETVVSHLAGEVATSTPALSHAFDTARSTETEQQFELSCERKMQIHRQQMYTQHHICLLGG